MGNQEDLRTSSLADFRTGLAEAAPGIIRRIDEAWAKRRGVLFNLTGGFKGVQGSLQALAMLKGVESLYVFETRSEMMRIPRLPVGVIADGVIRQNFDLFRRLNDNPPVSEAEVRAAGIPATLIFLLDGKAMLSEWGKALWLETWAREAREFLALAAEGDDLRRERRQSRPGAQGDGASPSLVRLPRRSARACQQGRRRENTQFQPLRFRL